MTAANGPRREFGEGPLHRAANVVYWVLAVELLFVATALPGIVVLTLIAPDASNVPLAALGLVPIGPAFSAAIFAWRAFVRDPGPYPARAFWRGYRLNALDVLRLWVPALALLTVVGTNLANLGAVTGGGALGPALTLIAAVTALWSVHALVLASLFAFRTRDVARLAVYFLVRRPLMTLGAASLLVLALGVVWLTSDWVLGLLASVFAYLVLSNERPMIAEAQERFVAPSDDDVLPSA